MIAAITSCTNTSNPSVMLAAGLLAKKAVERGLTVQAVGEDLARARAPGWSWTTTSGPGLTPLPREARLRPRRLRLHDLHRQLGPAAGRDLGGRPAGRPRRGERAVGQPQLRGPGQHRRAHELPGVAAARGGLRPRRHDGLDLYAEPIGTDTDGQPVYLEDIWPTTAEVAETVAGALRSDMFRTGLRRGVPRRRALAAARRADLGDATPGTTTPPTSASRRTSTA